MFSERAQSDLRNDLVYSIERGRHQKHILAFLKSNLCECATRLTGATRNDLASMCEDDISRQVVRLLNEKLREGSGYLFMFEAKRGPDIWIYAVPCKPFTSELFLIEAKRLPPTSPRDYVRTGIGRFKREEHGKEHEEAVLLGYIQANDFAYWQAKVNSWIGELIGSPDEKPSWAAQDRLCTHELTAVGLYTSTHSRMTARPIRLHHIWIRLVKDTTRN